MTAHRKTTAAQTTSPRSQLKLRVAVARASGTRRAGQVPAVGRIRGPATAALMPQRTGRFTCDEALTPAGTGPVL